MVNSWSCTPDQIEMFPNQDTITQLLPACQLYRLCLLVFAKGKLSPDVFLNFVSVNISTLGKTKLTVSLGTVH